MDYPNKKIDTTKASRSKGGLDVAAGPDVQTFTFPHYPHPIAVEAKDIHEAEEKFRAIIKTK